MYTAIITIALFIAAQGQLLHTEGAGHTACLNTGYRAADSSVGAGRDSSGLQGPTQDPHECRFEPHVPFGSDTFDPPPSGFAYIPAPTFDSPLPARDSLGPERLGSNSILPNSLHSLGTLLRI